MIKKKIILTWFIILILVIGVGYAYFSTTLYVNGTAKLDGNFDIRFDNANVLNMASNESINISEDGKTLSFDVKLATYGESDVINYTIINNGIIDATLDELVINTVDEDVTITATPIAGDLLSGASVSGSITITWNSDSTVNYKEINFEAYINANQKIN